ncbi:unnamed protein product [Schistocephalus solidus]|uniref:Major capsid protein n=1 Tax=Schistocephalus solidus TaxID=70667 RepID=A0A183TU61_SCHSO|nr:unnamed protein product [Schistocephalus solidus]
MLQQQLELIDSLIVKLSNSSIGQSSATGGSQSLEHTVGSITEYLNDTQAQIAFDSSYISLKDMLSVELATQDDAWKILPIPKYTSEDIFNQGKGVIVYVTCKVPALSGVHIPLRGVERLSVNISANCTRSLTLSVAYSLLYQTFDKDFILLTELCKAIEKKDALIVGVF